MNTIYTLSACAMLGLSCGYAKEEAKDMAETDTSTWLDAALAADLGGGNWTLGFRQSIRTDQPTLCAGADCLCLRGKSGHRH